MTTIKNVRGDTQAERRTAIDKALAAKKEDPTLNVYVVEHITPIGSTEYAIYYGRYIAGANDKIILILED